MNTRVNLVVALPSEAAPLIKAFDLVESRQQPFRVYENEDTSLIVAGVGKVLCASAVGYLAARHPHASNSIWLNVGSAGHESREIGSIALIDRITDDSSGARYYPSSPFKAPCPAAPLVCFDAATSDYAGDALCDMESSGFFVAASRISELEFIQCIKVVSDNRQSGFDSINRAFMSELLAGTIEPVAQTISSLRKLDTRHRPSVPTLSCDELLGRFRLTSTQRVQLRSIAHRWALVADRNDWPPAEMQSCRNGRELIQCLIDALEARAGNVLLSP